VPRDIASAMSSYELSISLDIFRGRYRTSFEHPEALKPNQPQLFKFDLPHVQLRTRAHG
jgi:hypothetical protein